ncbi:unnamed protein product, partial [Mesorhabditis belari]|uniref:Uncharacterized protein n=1 Tax=Mesorhabditis belari TaxID=2138241 RepID=A0AAF3FFK2_9BILA
MIEYGLGSFVLNSLGTIVLCIAIRITSPTVKEMLQEMENEENQQQDLQNSDHDDNQDAEPGSSQQPNQEKNRHHSSNGKEDEESPILIILVGICTSIYFLDTMGRHSLPKGQIHAGCIYSDFWEWFYVILVMYNDSLEFIESLLCHCFILSVAIKCFRHFYCKGNTTG